MRLFPTIVLSTAFITSSFSTQAETKSNSTSAQKNSVKPVEIPQQKIKPKKNTYHAIKKSKRKKNIAKKETAPQQKLDVNGIQIFLKRFYEGIALQNPRGIPEVINRPFYQAHLSSNLLNLLMQTKTIERACLKTSSIFAENTKTQQGNIFLGNFLDNEKNPTYRNIVQKNKSITVDVDFLSSWDVEHMRKMRWIDQVELIQDGAHWRINNIKFRIDKKNDLRENLADELTEFITTGDDACTFPVKKSSIKS